MVFWISWNNVFYGIFQPLNSFYFAWNKFDANNNDNTNNKNINGHTFLHFPKVYAKLCILCDYGSWQIYFPLVYSKKYNILHAFCRKHKNIFFTFIEIFENKVIRKNSVIYLEYSEFSFFEKYCKI